MDTSEQERATEAGYDRWAAFYDDNDPSTWLDEPFLLKHLQPFAACRILDIGCGTGRYLKRLVPSTYRITGIDLSRKMLTRARRQTGSRSDVSFVQASAGFLPFHPCSFDRIMSGLVIDHLAFPEQLFREMSAVLTLQGHAVVAAVHPEMQRITGQDVDIRSGQEASIHIPGHLHEVDRLLAAVHDAGMTVVARDEPYATPAMLEHRPSWTTKIGHPVLLLLALAKSTSRTPRVPVL